MPIHDWSRVDAGVFHDFHQAWTIGVVDALNAGMLPPEFFAMVDQIDSPPIPDVVTLEPTYEATWAKCPDPLKEAVER